MPKVKKLMRQHPEKVRRRLTRTRLLKAVVDSGGVLTEIAKRLDCTYHALWSVIKNEKFPDVNERIEEEKEVVGDLAERTVKEVMQQRLDVPSAARTARWWLERKCSDRGFKEKKELTLEGGKRPLQVNQGALIPIDELNLPLEVRRELLKAIEEQKVKALTEGGG